MDMIVGCTLTIMVFLIGIYLLYKRLKLAAASLFVLGLAGVAGVIGNDFIVLIPSLLIIWTILWYKAIVKTGYIIGIDRVRKNFIISDIIFVIAQVVMIYLLIVK